MNNRRSPNSPARGSPTGDKQELLRSLACNPITSQFFFPGALFVVAPWAYKINAWLVTMVDSEIDPMTGQVNYYFRPIGHCYTDDPKAKAPSTILPFNDVIFDKAMNFKTDIPGKLYGVTETELGLNSILCQLGNKQPNAKHKSFSKSAFLIYRSLLSVVMKHETGHMLFIQTPTLDELRTIVQCYQTKFEYILTKYTSHFDATVETHSDGTQSLNLDPQLYTSLAQVYAHNYAQSSYPQQAYMNFTNSSLLSEEVESEGTIGNALVGFM